MLSPLEAQVWVLHMLRVEEDAYLYRYPRTDDDVRAADRLAAIRDEVWESIGGDVPPEVWRSAMEKWDSHGD